MSINKTNYESFFLDYHEENLSPLQVADVLLFVEQHPELKQEFENFENIKIEDLPSITFDNKVHLKKDVNKTKINKTNCEEYFIKSVENILSIEEKESTETFLQQNPKLIAEFDLYKKTIVELDFSIVFENKNLLKLSAEYILIANSERLLTIEESNLLTQILIKDKFLQQQFELYKKTRLVADTSITFGNKDKLKRKGKKIIPFSYYISLAASVLLLFGLFFLFNHNINKINIVENNKQQKSNSYKILVNNSHYKINNFVKSNSTVNAISKNTSIATKRKKKMEKAATVDSVFKKLAILHNQTIADSQKMVTTSESSIILNEVTTKTNDIIRIESKKEEENIAVEFFTLKELVTSKLKEKTLDNSTIKAQMKDGRIKKITLWDIAQLVTKGMAKISGKDIELKPEYNENGNVTAFAFNVGNLEITRGKKQENSN